MDARGSIDIFRCDRLRRVVSPASLDVRDARADDAPGLVRLYRRAYKENERMGFPSRMTSVERDTMADWIRTRSVFVATANDALVGAVQVISRSDWNAPELGRLAVDPDEQERGIGNRLLAHAERHVRSEDWTRVRLRTFTGHPFLEGWYRRHGYERVGLEPLADRPFDALVFEKEL